MAKSKKSAGFDHEELIKGLQSLLETLPSESQKQDLNNAFTELIGFLRDLQNFFLAMPSTEDVTPLRQSLPKLEEFYALAGKVSAITTSIGAGRKPAKQNGASSPKKEIEIDVEDVLSRLAALPVDQIKSQLGGRKYTVEILRAIAERMGAKPDSSATKKSLVSKIANDIANRRMFDGLAGRSNGEPAVN